MTSKYTWAALLPVVAGLVLAACGSGGTDSGAGNTNSSGANGGTTSGASLSGSVHGGQSPVSGSTVTLYAAGSGLAAAAVLGSTTSDAGGGWSLSSYTCPSPDAATYVVASGGNPGLTTGTNNSALKLMAALGPCGSLAGTVNIDEVTTVAAAYALNGFIGSNGCIDCSSGVPIEVSNVHGKDPGLSNAMGNAARLASVVTGSASPPLPSASACAASTAPANCGAEERLNALANSLAACVNSTGPSSAQCVALFDCATPGATFTGSACTVPGGSSLAADTLTAALEIARNPGQVPVAGVYDVATRNPVFSPALSAAPSDWTLALNFGGGGLSNKQGFQPSTENIAIDAGGNAWVANSGNNSLSEFSAGGTALTGNSGYTGGGLDQPFGIAIDASGNVWVGNGASEGLSKFSSAGTALSGSAGYTGGGLNGSTGLAIDSSGNVWVASFGNNSVAEFNSAGTALSGTSGYTGGGIDYPTGIAIDASGNVWLANESNSSLSEFNSAGTALSGSGGYTGGGLNNPEGLAIDASGNVWVGNYREILSEFSSVGTALSGSGGYTGGGQTGASGVAIDAAGNVWLANYGGSNLSEFSSAGTALSGNSGYTGGGLNNPSGIAIDPSGDVWVENFDNTLTELIGAATPTRTPLVNAINSGFTP